MLVMTAQQDVFDLLDYTWGRLVDRMGGLTDDEWAWRPSSSDPDLSIRWRLDHIVSLLTEDRIAPWLGYDAPPGHQGPAATSASSALASMPVAYAWFRERVADPDVDLDAEVGPLAGPFASATRRSFVLHIADELIHHGAEAALLRDLYAAR